VADLQRLRGPHNEALKLTAPMEALERGSLARCYPDTCLYGVPPVAWPYVIGV